MTKSFVLSLALSLSLPAYAKSVEIKSFTPQNISETTNQVRAVFTDQVVELGQKNANDVFNLECTPAAIGTARWDDTSSWVFDFDTKVYQNNLPGGTQCTASLKPAFKRTKKIAGRTTFSFTIDGPNVLRAYPGDREGKYVETIQEDQIVVLGFDAKIDEASLKANAYFKISGIASPVQIAIVGENEKRALAKSDNFPVDILELPHAVLIKPVTRLPNDKKIDLIIGKGVKSSESGISRLHELKIPYASRPVLNATFTCTRENKNAGCSPFAPMQIIFSSAVSSDKAREIKLVAADGTVIPAEIEVDSKGEAAVFSVSFPAQYKDNQDYKVVLPEGITDESGRPLANAAAVKKWNVETGDFPALAKFAADFGLIESSDPVLPATLRNLEARVAFQKGVPTEIQGTSVRLDVTNFAAVVKWLKRLDVRSRNNYEDVGTANDSRRKSIFADLQKGKPTTKFEIPMRDNGKAFEVVRIDLKSTGFHVVELQSKILGNSLIANGATMYVPSSALVTNLVVHAKWGRESSLFWVTELETGASVANSKVTAYDCTGAPSWTGTTNHDGWIQVTSEQLKINFDACNTETAGYTGSEYDRGFFVSAQRGEDFTFTFSGWQDGIEPFRFGYNGVNGTNTHQNSDNTIAHTVLDRTLFRAGETVGMKHYLRAPTSQGMVFPKEASLPNQIRIVNYEAGAEYVFPISFRQDGTSEFEFAVPKDAKLGQYNIYLERKVGEDVTKTYYSYNSFSVLEYKVPLLKGSITFAKTQELVQPGALDAKLGVTYMDGGPVANERVKFRYTISQMYGKYFEGFNMSFGTKKVVAGQASSSNDDGGVKTFERPVTLDANGSRVESIPGLSGLDSGRNVTAELEYTDRNGETQTISRGVEVFPAARLVGVSVENWLGSLKGVKFQAAVVDLKGQAVKGAIPEFQVFETITYTHKTSMVGGFYTSESTTEIKAVNATVTCSQTLNKKNTLDCVAKMPESGNYVIQASVRDQDGNISYGSTYVTVVGSAQQWYPAQNSDRIDLIAEKKDVQAGETAVLRVETEFADANVLVTVEREGVLEQFVTRLSSRDPRIRVPIKASYAPNVYISALVVRGRISQNQATATIDPGKPAYQIGLTNLNVNRAPNTLTVSVKALDASGAQQTKFKPRQAVKAKVAITKQVQAHAGSQQVPAANAEFALAVIDKGLLQLSSNDTWNLLEAMLGNRQLEVQTATAQMQVVGKRHYGMKAKPTGGDGADLAAGLTMATRELFDTRVKWIGRVVTDAKGEATVDFTTNDSPSEFVIVAIASQGTDKFGKGETSFVSQPDIMVLPAIGTVVRNGDVYSQEFTLRNTTTSMQKLTVKGQVTFTLKNGKTVVVDLQGKAAEIASQGDTFINLGDVTVPEGAVKSTVVWTVTNAQGQQVDQIKVDQEVKPAILPRVWAAELAQIGTQGVRIPAFIPADAHPGESLIKVQLMPTLAAGLSTVTDTLANYPFQSLELIVSRAVATSNEALWDDAMKRLPSHLDANGLVMYYPNSTSSQGSDALTAYILSVANYSGFVVPDESAERMFSGLTSVIEGRLRGAIANETAVITYIRRVNAIEVLARYGRADASWLTALKSIPTEQIPTATLIDLLSIYSNLEIEGGAEKLQETESRLQARLTRVGTGLVFTAKESRYWFMMTSAHAEQLELILVLSKNDALASRWAKDASLLIRGALGMMQAGKWDLTVANAIGVLSFKAYAAKFEEGQPTGETQIAINQVKQSWNWDQKPEGGLSVFTARPGNYTVDLTHKATGLPWSITSIIYAKPLTQKLESHIRVTKTLTPAKAVYKKGDVVTVTLRIEPQTDLPMVSIMDPIPAGAKILGTGLDNDRDQGAVIQQGWAWPDYESKTYDAYNVSFYEIQAGGITLAYKVQLNNAGQFKLPATRVEAIYLPENFAEVPNESVTVKP